MSDLVAPAVLVLNVASQGIVLDHCFLLAGLHRAERVRVGGEPGVPRAELLRLQLGLAARARGGRQARGAHQAPPRGARGKLS